METETVEQPVVCMCFLGLLVWNAIKRQKDVIHKKAGIAGRGFFLAVS
jgi:hypothetical protein